MVSTKASAFAAVLLSGRVRSGGVLHEPGSTITVDHGVADEIEALDLGQILGPADETPAAVTEEEIVHAIHQLDPANEGHFTKQGKPEVKAIEAQLGRQISAKDRDAAWEIVEAEKAAEAKDGSGNGKDSGSA